MSGRKLEKRSSLYMQKLKEELLRERTNGEVSMGVGLWRRKETLQCLLVVVGMS